MTGITRADIDVIVITEVMARILYDEGAYCGDCDYAGWKSCPVCRQTCRDYAKALVKAGFGMVKP